MCSIFAHTLYYLCNLIFAKECLKTYDALIHYVRKNRNFAFQAINSENDRNIGRKYNGNLPVTFKENSFVVA